MGQIQALDKCLESLICKSGLKHLWRKPKRNPVMLYKLIYHKNYCKPCLPCHCFGGREKGGSKLKTLIIAGQLPSLNAYTLACRSHRQKGARMKKEAEMLISLFIMQQLKGVHFDGAVKLSFRWYEPNRKRDLDNVCFAKKFILDALVRNRIIVADGWKGVVGFTDQFFVDSDNPRIEVDIEKAGED